MVVTFCGHSKCLLSDNEKEYLENCLLKIINDNADCTFYLGHYGNFDYYCFEILSKLKLIYKDIQLVFVTPYITKGYFKLEKLSTECDETLYPPIENVPPRYAIIRRNMWMVENSNLLVCYINHTFGGAYKTYKYAINKKITTINIYNQKTE